MHQFRLPRVIRGRNIYHAPRWRSDTRGDPDSPLRVYFDLDPEIEKWLNDHEVRYGIVFERTDDGTHPDFVVAIAPYVCTVRCWLVIEDTSHAVLFRLTWM